MWLKNVVKTRCKKQLTLNLFEQFVHFKPHATSFLGLILSLTSISKSKKTLEMSLDLTLSFKTSIDTRVKVLASNVDYLENWCRNFIQKKYGRKKDVCYASTFRSLDCHFYFCTDFLHH